jgi:hypothetical protein
MKIRQAKQSERKIGMEKYNVIFFFNFILFLNFPFLKIQRISAILLMSAPPFSVNMTFSLDFEIYCY